MQIEDASPVYDFDELVEFFKKINSDEALCETAITNIAKYGTPSQQYAAKTAFLYFKNTKGSSSDKGRDKIFQILEDVRVKWAIYLKNCGCNITSAEQVVFR